MTIKNVFLGTLLVAVSSFLGNSIKAQENDLTLTIHLSQEEAQALRKFMQHLRLDESISPAHKASLLSHLRAENTEEYQYYKQYKEERDDFAHLVEQHKKSCETESRLSRFFGSGPCKEYEISKDRLEEMKKKCTKLEEIARTTPDYNASQKGQLLVRLKNI